MTVYKDAGTWRYRKVVKLESGRVRISGTPQINTKAGATTAEREHIERVIRHAVIEKHAPDSLKPKAKVPTFGEFFDGRYWTEHAIGEKENREGTRAEKKAIFARHLGSLAGLALDLIDTGAVNQLRAELKEKLGRTGKPLSEKTRANILNVVSNVLKYAGECGVLANAPRVKVKKPTSPETETWDFEQYGRLLGAAIQIGGPMHTAVLLAGDAGFRIGEILALNPATDVDFVAGTATISRQMRRGAVGVPKGGKPRIVPLTPRLVERLRTMKDEPSIGLTEGDAKHEIYSLHKLAGLPQSSWHRCRHAWATHAALLGVSPMWLRRWGGWSGLEMVLRYVHFVDERPWPIPDMVLMSGAEILRPERRITAQLGARAPIAPAPCQSPANEKARSGNRATSLRLVVAGAGFEPATFGL
ncbi:MAG: tyrosine-type recombinase/integrase [Deltaproteobacteria bacterium]|nr:tyrosine-type recombinase/integrase [Deltaproteobacteria bacterium]